MEEKCCFCEEIIELPEMVNSFDEVVCPGCNSWMNMDTKSYIICSDCGKYTLSIFNECLECGKLPSESIFTSDSGIIICEKDILEPRYLHVKNDEEYRLAIKTIENLEILALDTEGNGLDPYTMEMFLIQMGNEEIVFIFDYHWFDKLKKENFWNDKGKKFILHNAKYDYKVIKYFLGITLENIFDTMLAERLLTCGIIRENSLKAVVKKYFKLEMDKEIRNDFITMRLDNFDKKVSKELIEYSARDVVVLPPIYRIQKILLRNEGLEDIAQLEFDTAKVLGDMELSGIHVDIEKWKGIIIHNQLEKERVEKQIYEYIDENCPTKSNEEIYLLVIAHEDARSRRNDAINLNSSLVLKKLFKKLNVEIENTSEQTLAGLHNPLAELIREYRGFEKQLSSFGQSFLDLANEKTGRIHPNFSQIGADTGRMSCNKPNMQQIPATEEYRSCFSAPGGRKIVTCDYSQQELRLLASLSGDPKFIKMYEDGVDLHSATASLMYNIPIDQVPKDKRSAAKTINFGLAYGRGAKALAEFLGISKEEGEEMIKIYFSQFSFIGDWLNNAAKFSQEKGYSTTLFGRKRFYKLPTENSQDYSGLMARIGRQGKNSPIQGSGADMAKMALVIIRKKLQSTNIDAFLTNAVHDEIVIESSEQDADKALEILEKSMIEAGQMIVRNVPILAEGGVYDFWQH